MYNILPESDENVIGIRVINDLRTEDYATLLPFIHRLILKHGRIRVLTDLREFDNPHFWSSFKVTPRLLRYSKSVEREAIITDEKWILIFTKFVSSFFKTEVRVFPASDFDKAWDWVRR